MLRLRKSDRGSVFHNDERSLWLVDMMDDDELCLAGTAITHTLYIFPNPFLPLLHSATAPLYRVTAALFAKLLFA